MNQNMFQHISQQHQQTQHQEQQQNHNIDLDLVKPWKESMVVEDISDLIMNNPLTGVDCFVAGQGMEYSVSNLIILLPYLS